MGFLVIRCYRVRKLSRKISQGTCTEHLWILKKCVGACVYALVTPILFKLNYNDIYYNLFTPKFYCFLNV